MKNAGILYIVATPIGNLGDMTLRAIETLKHVDLIACEDTRVTGVLLKHFDIKKPMVSYFAHSKLAKIEYLISELQSGRNIALVTDAGTPGISDPGQSLIAQVKKSNIKNQNFGERSALGSIEKKETTKQQDDKINIIPIPGASALTGAASVSGTIEKEFFFAGFLPKKKGRQTKFKQLKELKVPIVIYESAMRLERTLRDIENYLGADTEVFLAREMTKMFEEYWGGQINEVMLNLANHKLKGEIVLIIQKSNLKSQN